MALVLGRLVSAELGEEFAARVASVRRLHEQRARAELDQADRACPGSDVVASAGDVLAEVLLLKGLPGPAEAAGGDALSGADGEAVSKALEALGWSPAHSFRALSCPSADLDPALRAKRVRLLVEAVDPRVVIALDELAASDLARAYEIAPLRAGAEVQVAGRRLVAVGGFEASLNDPRRKKVAWSQLRVATPRGPSY